VRTSEVARLSGVSADTIRLYERRGLLPRPARTAGNYRQYPAGTAERVRLVRRALAIGFTLEELRVVLASRDRGEAPCRAVRTLAAEKLEALEARLAEMAVLRDRIRAVLRDWDARLSRTPRGERAGLLQALVDLVPDGSVSPLVPGRRPRVARG
jgi:MerR family transcriptional regulator, copper efflux regulator